MSDEKEIQRQGSEYSEEPADILDSATPRIPKKIIIAAIAVVVVGILGISGYTIYEKIGASKQPKEVEVDSSQIIDNSYTQEQIESLRAAGYTGAEIEKYQTELADANYLLQEAKSKQEAFMKNTYEELKASSMNSASPEFKELLDKTWLGGPSKKVINADIMQYETESKKEIVDYVKLPARGTQLFVRLTMNDGSYAFLAVHPSRWSQLPEVGNMVVTYESVKFGDEFFIMNLMEVQV